MQNLQKKVVQVKQEHAEKDAEKEVTLTNLRAKIAANEQAKNTLSRERAKLEEQMRTCLKQERELLERIEDAETTERETYTPMVFEHRDIKNRMAEVEQVLVEIARDVLPSGTVGLKQLGELDPSELIRCGLGEEDAILWAGELTQSILNPEATDNLMEAFKVDATSDPPRRAVNLNAEFAKEVVKRCGKTKGRKVLQLILEEVEWYVGTSSNGSGCWRLWDHENRRPLGEVEGAKMIKDAFKQGKTVLMLD